MDAPLRHPTAIISIVVWREARPDAPLFARLTFLATPDSEREESHAAGDTDAVLASVRVLIDRVARARTDGDGDVTPPVTEA